MTISNGEKTMSRMYAHLALTAAAIALAACSTAQPGEEAGVTAGSSGSTTATGSTGGVTATTDTGATTGTGSSGGTGTAGAGTGIPALVNVNLQNVLNDLSVRLKVEQANIPVNAQVPIDVAANVCGVSVNVLSVSTGGQASCTAKTSSAELAQAVQQQVAAGGNVGGGDQTMNNSTTNSQ